MAEPCGSKDCYYCGESISHDLRQELCQCDISEECDCCSNDCKMCECEKLFDVIKNKQIIKKMDKELHKCNNDEEIEKILRKYSNKYSEFNDDY